MSGVRIYSPDGIPISRDNPVLTREQAREAVLKWAKVYEHQGYYSAASGERIPLAELPDRCTLEEADDDSVGD